MSNDFQIITSQDLKNLGISNYVKNMILQGVNLEQINIQNIFNLIENLINLIKMDMQQKNNNLKGYSYSFNKLKKENFKQIMLISGLLVFRIRQFLLNETLYYSLGATDENGKLFQKELSQDELWSQTVGKNTFALRSSLSSQAIMVSRTLEKFNSSDGFTQVGTLNLWPEVLKLAFLPSDSKGSDEEKGGSDYKQKFTPDKNVYIRFSEGKKRTKSYYYAKQGEYLFYNQGWLYEWYLTFINQSEQHELLLQNSLKNNSIAPIIYGMDNISGIQGGDFIDAQNRQVQAKYNNQKIISFTSVLTTLESMKIILQQLISSPSEIEVAANKFTDLFTTDATSITHLNKTYNSIIENQLLLLLKTNTK